MPAPERTAVAVVIVLFDLHFFGPFELGMEAVADSVPLSVPVAGGVNVTLTDTLCPGERVYGNASPFTAYPVPLTLIWDKLRLEVPTLLMLTVCVWLFPTKILPNAMLEGEIAICA
jgi:hypothetical protein